MVSGPIVLLPNSTSEDSVMPDAKSVEGSQRPVIRKRATRKPGEPLAAPTSAPAAPAMVAVASVEPSSTTRTRGKWTRTASTSGPIAAASLKQGMTARQSTAQRRRARCRLTIGLHPPQRLAGRRGETPHSAYPSHSAFLTLFAEMVCSSHAVSSFKIHQRSEPRRRHWLRLDGAGCIWRGTNTKALRTGQTA